MQSQDIDAKQAFITKVLTACANAYEKDLNPKCTVEGEAELLTNLIASLFVYTIEHRGVDPIIIDDIVVLLTRIAKERYEEVVPVM